jgi:hypothetical protein
MEIVWTEFTPVASFAGGAMIGVAALFLMLLNSRSLFSTFLYLIFSNRNQ